MEVDMTLVHAEHCCGVHGCKFGDDECGVAAGTLEQEFPCAYCRPGYAARSESETVDAITAWLEAHASRHFAQADLLEAEGAVEVANSLRERAARLQNVVQGIRQRAWKK